MLFCLAVAAHDRIERIAAQFAIDAVGTRRVETGQELVALFTDPAVGVGKAIALLHVFIDIDQFIRIRVDDRHFFIELIELFLVENQAVADIDGLAIALFFGIFQAFP